MPDFCDEFQLGLEEIDVLFLGLEDVLEQFARDVVTDRFTVGDGGLQVRVCLHLELEIALEAFLEMFADQELAEFLEVGQAFEEQDALDQLVRMLHLVDRLVVFVVAELVEPPVLEHPRMQEVLVDRREFVHQHDVQVLDDFWSPFMAMYSRETWMGWGRAPSGQEA